MTDENATLDRDPWRDKLTEEIPGYTADRRARAILKMYDRLREHGKLIKNGLAPVATLGRVRASPSKLW